MLSFAAKSGSFTRSVLVTLSLLLAAGCANVRPVPTAPMAAEPHVAECLRLFEDNDTIIRHADVSDAQATRLAAFPFLRTNRFLSSLRDELSDETARAAWIERLSRLDVEGRRIEIDNLPPTLQPDTHAIQALEQCREVLARAVLSDAAAFEAVRQSAVVADDYNPWARAAGLYPVTALFVLNGVERLHAAEGRYFKQDPDGLYQIGERVEYRMAEHTPAGDVSGIVRGAARDALGIPLISVTDMQRLFERHSPIWSIATRSPDDRIGKVGHVDSRPSVDPRMPTVYTHVSYTNFAGEILLQLNYTVWFPARKKSNPFDLYGGTLDGITWRATLDSAGHMLAADVMHNCGCYYMVFPTSALVPRQRAQDFAEPLWTPRTLPRRGSGARIVIHVSGDAHYIRQVGTADASPERTVLAPRAYDDLRSLPLSAGQRRSLFGTNGLVAASRRGERWLLWPMGIASAGAMRQVGHHAIAFVGRRHFDDPGLLENYFRLAEAPD